MRICYLFLILIITLPSAFGWNYYTHQDFIEGVYYLLDEEVRENLDVTLLREGAIAPDKVFKDYRRHHYPPSYEEAQTWLVKARDAYEQEDYANASYAFGVASHYVADSFSSPHNVEKEEGSLHQKYEKSNYLDHVVVSCPTEASFDLDSILSSAVQTGEDWETWVATKDKNIVRKHSQLAFEGLYVIAFHFFESSCVQLSSEVREETSLFSFDFDIIEIIFLGVISGVFIVITVSLYKE